jgi:hypothetical protein
MQSQERLQLVIQRNKVRSLTLVYLYDRYFESQAKYYGPNDVASEISVDPSLVNDAYTFLSSMEFIESHGPGRNAVIKPSGIVQVERAILSQQPVQFY